jgi:hypothetical protein
MVERQLSVNGHHSMAGDAPELTAMPEDGRWAKKRADGEVDSMTRSGALMVRIGPLALVLALLACSPAGPAPLPTVELTQPPPFVPATWSDEAATAAVVQELQAFLDAVTTQPTADYQRALAAYTAACRGNPEGFDRYVDDLRRFIGEVEPRLEIRTVERVLPDRVYIESELLLDGTPVLGLDRSFFQYEDGRWRNSTC